MFLLQKFREYKQNRRERSKRKITERELLHLNHKIDKLLVRLEEYEPEAATSPEDECVICISAKATMQTFPCGHRVVCRRCFVKTIQVAVSQRLLPLKCVICRTKILKLKQTSQGGINTSLALRSVEARISASSSSSSASSSNYSASASGTLYQLRNHSNTHRCRNYSSSLSSASSHSCDSVYSSSSSSSSSIADSVVSNSMTIQSQTGISSIFRTSNCFAKNNNNNNNSGKGYKSNLKLLASSKIYDASTNQPVIGTSSSSSSSSSSYSCTSSSTTSSGCPYSTEYKCDTSDSVTATSKVTSDNRWPMSKSNILFHQKNCPSNESINNNSNSNSNNSRKVIYSDRRYKGSNEWPFCRKNQRQIATSGSSSSSNCSTSGASGGQVDGNNNNNKVSFFASLSSSFSPCPSTVKKLTSHSLVNQSNCPPNGKTNNCISGSSCPKVHQLDHSTKKKYNDSLYHRRYSSYHKSLRSSSIQTASSLSSSPSSSSSPSPASASASSTTVTTAVASPPKCSMWSRHIYSSTAFNNSTFSINSKSSFGCGSGSFECNRNKRSKLHQLDTSTSFYSNCYFYGNKVSSGSCDSSMSTNPSESSLVHANGGVSGSGSNGETGANGYANNNLNGANGDHHHHSHHHHHHHHHSSHHSLNHHHSHGSPASLSLSLSHRSLNVSLIKSSTGCKSPNRVAGESLLPLVLPKIDENTDEGEDESDSSSENLVHLNATCNTFTRDHDNDKDDDDDDDDDVVETSKGSLVCPSEKEQSDRISDEKCHEEWSKREKVTTESPKIEVKEANERKHKEPQSEQLEQKEPPKSEECTNWQQFFTVSELKSTNVQIGVNQLTNNNNSSNGQMSHVNDSTGSQMFESSESKCTLELEQSTSEQFDSVNESTLKELSQKSHLFTNQVPLNGQNDQKMSGQMDKSDPNELIPENKSSNDKCQSTSEIIYPNLVNSSLCSSMEKLVTDESSSVQLNDELPRGSSSSSFDVKVSAKSMDDESDELQFKSNFDRSKSYLKLNESQLKRKSKFSFRFIGNLFITHLPSKSPQGKVNCENLENCKFTSENETISTTTTTTDKGTITKNIGNSNINNNNRIFYFSPFVSLLRRKISSHSSD